MEKAANHDGIEREIEQRRQTESDPGIEQAYSTELVLDEGTGEMYEQIVWTFDVIEN